MAVFRLRDFHASPEDEVLRHLGTASMPAFGRILKLASWNMFKAQRRGCISDLASVNAGADLVLLQEAVLQGGIAQPYHLASGMEWIMVENLRHTHEPLTTGPKTGSRVASASRAFVRSRDREPIINTPKSFLCTSYPLASGRTLRVLNVHAINLVSSAKFARQVVQMSEAIAGHEGPCIVAGDFNTWNQPRMHILQRAMTEAGLARVPAAAPQWRHLNQVLDHVFYRGMRLINARALAHIKSSDHVPLWAEFDLGVT